MKDVFISVQAQDFCQTEENKRLNHNNVVDGAVVTFTGCVRNKNEGLDVTALHLEHYPGMTEKSLEDIAKQASERWQLGRISIIHRVGTLALGEQIVFVGVTSKHRQDAFEGAQFIMDFLKVNAPFWKKEVTNQGEKWLDARKSDDLEAQKWAQS